ncbi:SLC13 family permease [Clavibacter michiganensis]|uniref:Arsenic transporter n=1 Tax=Clavibacter michiganensis subsp. insidiosus TaxID=33014 RepID=A0A0D5CFP1_9MICO|nr:SLC13 family permease [Clavibacter michiganensis]AJW78446.1 arsenic transporter [Clavibacter michiganensis subsp. insidiosus]AWF98928.1 arsenic transporter [Clavibacter michiganensis subsp. insidiosus]AWG00850.1 arsenic transporter [Clavibacter michiganensis subsp. insidiosus]OQJ60563.1 arsenic transporter [Clavibacter michiganensis subsp. insidiosus]RII86645.1 arsenic transporter [Clavibacter michiganensis subsp. insidiosus]
MRTALIGAVLLVVGAVAVATGALPLDDLGVLYERVWPILLFVVAITVVTELASEAGLFTWIAERAAGLGRGRTWALWLATVVLACLCTIFLSLDTTAVLLTPVVVVLARHCGLPPLPFALTTVWLANTASLLLPVSNLTNLLAEHELGGLGPAGFAALTVAPALVAIAVPVLAILVIHREDLLTRYEVGPPTASTDRVLLVGSAIVVGLLVPSLVSGVEVWIPALAAAVVLAILTAVRRPRVIRLGLLPWQLVVFASGLFIVMEAAQSLGLTAVMAAVSGQGQDAAALFRLAGVATLSANAVDNLPAYLALEPVAGSPERLVAILVGVNAGPVITPWASLATLLWHERLVSMGVHIRWSRYMLLGLVVAPLTVGLAMLAFVLTR